MIAGNRVDEDVNFSPSFGYDVATHYDQNADHFSVAVLGGFRWTDAVNSSACHIDNSPAPSTFFYTKNEASFCGVGSKGLWINGNINGIGTNLPVNCAVEPTSRWCAEQGWVTHTYPFNEEGGSQKYLVGGQIVWTGGFPAEGEQVAGGGWLVTGGCKEFVEGEFEGEVGSDQCRRGDVGVFCTGCADEAMNTNIYFLDAECLASGWPTSCWSTLNLGDPKDGRMFHSMVAVPNEADGMPEMIFMFGGMNDIGSFGEGLDPSVQLPEMWFLSGPNVSNLSWLNLTCSGESCTAGQNWPTARLGASLIYDPQSHSLLYYGGRKYCPASLCGVPGWNSDPITLWRYDITASTWGRICANCALTDSQFGPPEPDLDPRLIVSEANEIIGVHGKHIAHWVWAQTQEEKTQLIYTGRGGCIDNDFNTEDPYACGQWVDAPSAKDLTGFGLLEGDDNYRPFWNAQTSRINVLSEDAFWSYEPPEAQFPAGIFRAELRATDIRLIDTTPMSEDFIDADSISVRAYGGGVGNSIPFGVTLFLWDGVHWKSFISNSNGVDAEMGWVAFEITNEAGSLKKYQANGFIRAAVSLASGSPQTKSMVEVDYMEVRVKYDLAITNTPSTGYGSDAEEEESDGGVSGDGFGNGG